VGGSRRRLTTGPGRPTSPGPIWMTASINLLSAIVTQDSTGPGRVGDPLGRRAGLTPTLPPRREEVTMS